MAYTYLIGWSKLNKWYYGVRFAQNCNPSDLWVTYFTSSKYVKHFREENGEPDIIEIRKTFTDSYKARLWEYMVLKKLNVVQKNKWLNKCDGLCLDPTDKDIRKKMKESRKKLFESGYKTPNPTLRDDVKEKLRIFYTEKCPQTGMQNRNWKGKIKTPFGIFNTQKEAAEFEGTVPSVISVRVNSNKYPDYIRIIH